MQVLLSVSKSHGRVGPRLCMVLQDMFKRILCFVITFARQ